MLYLFPFKPSVSTMDKWDVIKNYPQYNVEVPSNTSMYPEAFLLGQRMPLFDAPLSVSMMS